MFPPNFHSWRSAVARGLCLCMALLAIAMPIDAKTHPTRNKPTPHHKAKPHPHKTSHAPKVKAYHKPPRHPHGLDKLKAHKTHSDKAMRTPPTRAHKPAQTAHKKPQPRPQPKHAVSKHQTKHPKVAHVKSAAITHTPPVFPAPPGPSGPLSAVRYRVVKVGSFGCNVVDIDLNTPGIRLTCARAEELGHNRMTFTSLVRHHRPIAAITGTFFDPSSGTVICNLVRSGKLLTNGHHGNTMTIDHDQRAHLLDTANRAGHEIDWSKSEFAVSCGPTLLRKGRVVLDPSSEGFRDPGLFRRASRCGIALAPNNHLLLVSVNRGVTLGGFARIMKQLGAQDAINLDGGSSTGLYVRGRYPSRPGRSLTNLILVTVRPGDPLPAQVEMESADSPDETAPANVVEEDFEGPAPSPEQTRLNLEQETL